MIKKEGNAKLMDAVAQNMTFQKKVKTVNFANTAKHNMSHQLVKPPKDQEPIKQITIIPLALLTVPVVVQHQRHPT